VITKEDFDGMFSPKNDVFFVVVVREGDVNNEYDLGSMSVHAIKENEFKNYEVHQEYLHYSKHVKQLHVKRIL
jgi:hypothetical protein